jgi:hypothetical protein
MPEAEAAAADRAAGTTRACPSTQGSTAAGTTAATIAEGAVTTAGITKPPPQGRVDMAWFISIFFQNDSHAYFNNLIVFGL